MITSYSELNEEHIDALREMGNIGAGNAATSLGVLLNEDVIIDIPRVRIEDYTSVMNLLGGPEEKCVAVLIRFFGDAEGVILFILTLEDAKRIMDIFVADDDSDPSGLSDMKISMIKELGNILGSSYVGSMSKLTDMRIDLSIPHIAIDMTGAILAAPIIEYGAHDSKVLFIEERFSTKDSNMNSHVILFTGMQTLREIMDRLGFEL